MSEIEVPRVDLFDPAREPSDDELESLMDSAIKTAIKNNQKGEKLLKDKLDLEMAQSRNLRNV